MSAKVSSLPFLFSFFSRKVIIRKNSAQTKDFAKWRREHFEDCFCVKVRKVTRVIRANEVESLANKNLTRTIDVYVGSFVRLRGWLTPEKSQQILQIIVIASCRLIKACRVNCVGEGLISMPGPASENSRRRRSTPPI